MSVMIMMMTINVLDDPTVVEIDLTPQLEVTKLQQLLKIMEIAL